MQKTNIWILEKRLLNNFRLETEKQTLKQDVMDSQKQADTILIEKNLIEKDLKNTSTKLHDIKLQLNESLRNLTDVNNSRKQIIDEKNRLSEELEEKELSESQCKQTQLSLKTQLTSTIKLLHDETNVSYYDESKSS